MALLLAAVVCACSDLPVAPTGSPIVRPTIVPILPVHTGGTLYVQLPKSEAVYDPLHPVSKEMMSLYALVFEPLVRMDEQGKPTPALAEKWELALESAVTEGEAQAEPSERWTWTITLRQNVFWHDAAPLTAHDVAYTIDRIQGDEGENPYKALLKNITGHSVVGDREIKLFVKKPFYGLLEGLVFPIVRDGAYGALSETAEDEPQAIANAAGTGPYRLESFQSADQMVLQANQSWWRRAPSIETIHAIVPRDEQGEELDAIQAFQQGDIDVLHTSEIGASKLANYPGVHTAECAGDYYDFLALNVDKPLFSSAAVRRALSMAIDRKDITSSVYMGQALSVDIPFLPDSWLYDRSAIVVEYKADRADRLLIDAGWVVNRDGVRVNANGEEMTFSLLVNDQSDFPQRKEVAARIVRQLDKLGIRVQIEIKPWEKYLQALEAGEYDAALAGYRVGATPDFTYMLGSSEPANIARYASAQTDALLEQVLEAADGESLLSAAKALQAEFLEQMPHIPLYYRTGLLLYNQRVDREPLSLRDSDAYRGIERWTILDRP